ncbi:conserved hypothetical protein [Tenacibaculum litopenaei]|uniref:SMI1/KNR4 family protein n=1 Tax=Tenacibaculum litopenaei TaxID=396016 RepID=UPI0038948E2E
MLEKIKQWKETYEDGSGVSINEIQMMEERAGVEFPESYKSFLLHVGEEAPFVRVSHNFDYLESFQEDAKSWLTEFGFDGLVPKPFWVFAVDYDSRSLFYFPLNKGGNPPVYRLACEAHQEEPDEFSFGKLAENFEDWISSKIARYTI